MTNDSSNGAELSQNASFKPQLKEGATQAGSEPATPLTEWLENGWKHAWDTHTFDRKSECWKHETLLDYLEAKLTAKYGNPSRIADLERQLAESVSKAEVARMCYVEYKGVWIYCPPSELAMTSMGITPDMAKEGER
jgi:hypothetical protein